MFLIYNLYKLGGFSLIIGIEIDYRLIKIKIDIRYD